VHDTEASSEEEMFPFRKGKSTLISDTNNLGGLLKRDHPRSGGKGSSVPIADIQLRHTLVPDMTVCQI